MTTDQSGCSRGYVGANTKYGAQYNAFNNNSGNYSENSNCNYVSTFNGTSSAAPTVAGVVALMLDANEALTWRDVKHILANTAVKVDATRTFDITRSGSSTVRQYEWETNAAGYEFHNWYGFGKIDAAAAVTSAASYTANSRGTFVDTGYISSGTINQAITYGTTTRDLAVTKPSGSNNFVEFVRVTVRFSDAAPKFVGLRLLSPGGTVVNILQPLTNITTNPSSTVFDIGVNALYGEVIEGTWTLAIDDYVDNTNGALTLFAIQVYGN